MQGDNAAHGGHETASKSGATDRAEALFEELWNSYVDIGPHAQSIRDLLGGEQVRNDHVALRGLNWPSLGIEALAAPFLDLGYRQGGTYQFPEKHLTAIHLDAPRKGLPKVFVSELQTEALSDEGRAILASRFQSSEYRLGLGSGLPPHAKHLSEYERLLEESEYAAWLYAFGFVVNHFTVAVHELPGSPTLEEVNGRLIEAGYELNQSGGTIKGTPEVGLEQSSTLAAPATVRFNEGEKTIPGVFYEFARRHEVEGELFAGFVAGNADRIFESTDVRR